MRTINAALLTRTVAALCRRANTTLSPDVDAALARALENETGTIPRAVLQTCRDNLRVAERNDMAVCQDTGLAVVFLTLGQEVYVDGDLNAAIDEGVRLGYREGCLRASVVSDPLRRVNTGDNTPATLHIELVPGDMLEITVAPKGFGSENMSRLWMLTPSATEDDVVERLVETVRLAGGNPCPPVVVGAGLGGTAESCLLAAKKALLRGIGSRNPDGLYDRIEERALAEINALGIGPQGLGGHTTALAVHLSPLPTHIAGLPLGVNLGCHVTRHATARL